eukprot:INCI11873.1.p1 GENE.INCI11873.1~~INCI11873.1.p1  ORF type:complete len:541 (-),score=102.48 INCI11873.1:114-1736(-)
MGVGASVQAPPFDTIEAALAAGKTQEEIDSWLKATAHKSKDSSNSSSSSNNNNNNNNGEPAKGTSAQATTNAQASASVTSASATAGEGEDANVGANADASGASATTGDETGDAGAGEGAGPPGDEANGIGAMPMPDWTTLFEHKGDFHAQVEKFGPEPDFSSASDGWYWYGQSGDTGPELVLAEARAAEPAAAAEERPADVFYLHPTTSMGALWNMPLADEDCRSQTEYFITSEASAFAGACRVFVPRFRQAGLTAMGFAKEGKLATEFAYADIKKAFAYYLENENKGRPFILASHSQGSLYTLRLMLDFIEGKPLFNQFVACYGLAAWAPLSLFEGPTAVFQQIKLCRGPTDVGCFISWTCEHPETVKQHTAKKQSKEPGDWYPQMGHRVGEDEWRIAHGEPIVCTHPLTWISNGLSEPAEGATEDWLGMLNILDGGVVTGDGSALESMDALSGALMYQPKAEFQFKKLARLAPEEFNAKLEAEFQCSVNAVTGDLELPALPALLAGSMIESYEHLNFLLFWFNIRRNVAQRVQAKLAQ